MAKGMGDLLKQAQMMQSKMESIQKELANKRVEASVGGGMVRVTADGQQNILDIKITASSGIFFYGFIGCLVKGFDVHYPAAIRPFRVL